MWRLVPSEGRYVVPKVKLARPWYFHVTTEVDAHAVDALTGADGTTVESYMETHWTEVDAIVWREER